MFYTEQELVWQKITRSGMMYRSVKPNVWQVWKLFKKSELCSVFYQLLLCIEIFHIYIGESLI